MVILIISGDEFKLTSDNQEKLKREILGRYPDNAEVKITDSKGNVYDILKLSDLFETP